MPNNSRKSHSEVSWPCLSQNEKDRRNVCGVPAIYTLLEIMDVKKTRLLQYDQSVDPAAQSVVTFMGAALYA